MMRPFVLKQDLRPQMSKPNQNVQKLDVQSLDIIRGVLAKSFHRVIVRTRKFRMNWWTGAVAGEETVTTVEPSDARL
jgi:hypothetical protein